MELRAPLTAVVAAALHRRRQLVRTAERADEQRHEQRNERFRALEQVAALEVRAAGALGGYLVFNTNKASVFMGDTGSLSLGGLIAAVSVFSGNLLYIAIIGIMFVLSSISVILQVIYYKKTKRRIFLMAPLHHHFQMKGYSESKITFVYSAITAAMGLLCLCFV